MTENRHDQRLFWGCFAALVATSFGFIIRALVIDDWAMEFDLTETQKGEIFGVGLWPFAISIIFFSLIIDRIGYGRTMAFAFGCHIVSAIITITATGYGGLWVGQFVVALGNGAVEAVINPVVATMFVKDKTKWLNILHAGWPGGLVIGGLLVLIIVPGMSWQIKVGLIILPTIVYAIMLFGQKFPVQERVAAGVTHKDMLKEMGIIGALIAVSLIVFEVGNQFGFNLVTNLVLIALLTGVYGWYVKSLGRPLFIFLMLIMMPLATTELGTDSWVSDLMGPAMAEFGLKGGWVLVYTSFIMMVLRFCAGPIVHKFSPLGLLAICSLIAACGLVFLSVAATGWMILIAATLYGVGKTFFWPTMLGVVSERFPKGGAMTLNAMGGIGMLSVGIVGAVFLGHIQDDAIDKGLLAYDNENKTTLHAEFVTPADGIFGKYNALDGAKVGEASKDNQELIGDISAQAKKGALKTIAIFPIIMMVCFLGLILYFKSQGGYKAVDLGGEVKEGASTEA